MAGDFVRKGEDMQRWSREQEAEIGLIPLWVKESLSQQTLEDPREDSSLNPSGGTWSF